MRNATVRSIVASMGIVLLAGCGGQGARQPTSAEPQMDFVDMLRKTISFDFDPYESPAKLRRAVDFAGVGRVESIGSALVDEPEGPDTGAVVVGVRISEVWKEGVGSAGTDLVYFVVRRPTNVDADTFAGSLMQDSRVAFFGTASTLPISEGMPAGPVYSPSPQGLIVESGARPTADNVWGDEVNGHYPGWSGASTIDGVRSALGLK